MVPHTSLARFLYTAVVQLVLSGVTIQLSELYWQLDDESKHTACIPAVWQVETTLLESSLTPLATGTR